MANKQISNPYYKVGILHNEGLDYVVKNLKPRKATIEAVLGLVSEYGQQVTEARTQIDMANYYEFAATSLNGLNQIPFAEFLREGKVTREGVCFINDILNVSPDFDYPTQLEILKNINSNILYSDMTEKEKQYPLLMAGIAMASVEYWIEQINAPKTPWTPFLGGESPARFSWPWKKDGEGAVIGAIGGVTGGIGGVLVGGLLGGIGASVAAVIFRD